MTGPNGTYKLRPVSAERLPDMPLYLVSDDGYRMLQGELRGVPGNEFLIAYSKLNWMRDSRPMHLYAFTNDLQT